ncbi:MAG: site-specific integrase [Ignavibacteriales bacterium]|nr:site-specific integrase [Ignavibacteriales bacterium]
MNSTKLYLTKRNNGIYYIGYYEGAKLKWKSTRERIKSDALKQLSDFKKLLAHKPKEISLSLFSNQLLSYLEQNYSKNTCAYYRIAFRHLLEIANDISLSSLTPQHFDKYKSKRLAEVTPVTVNIELETLRAALNTAKRWKLLHTNPVEEITKCVEPQQTPAFFAKEDFEMLLSLIKEQWLKETIMFAVCTGMRRGEILNLRWSNIDFERKTISIESDATFKVKCGKRRVLPMSDVCYFLLKQRHEKTVSEFIFTLNGKHIDKDWLSHLFKRYVRQAGMSERLKFHSLRSTFASWLVMSGTEIYAVSKLLGHGDVSVTTKHYAHLKPETLASEVNKISFVMN